VSGPPPASRFGDFRPSGNQAPRPDIYELENRALDPGGLVLAAMRRLAPWRDATIVDLGCGSGYWLAGYADEASTVIGIEPDPVLIPLARARVGDARVGNARVGNARARVTVLEGSAEHLPLADASVDVVHARFAYFFPPACEAGLAEVRRVLRPGGRLVVVDNDHDTGQFAELLGRSAGVAGQGRADTTDEWWRERGADRVTVMSEWRFERRRDLEAVLRLEFPAEVADPWLADHPAALGLTYGYVLFSVGQLPYPQATT
jgi:SAM-dependent methyltransferase